MNLTMSELGVLIYFAVASVGIISMILIWRHGVRTKNSGCIDIGGIVGLSQEWSFVADLSGTSISEMEIAVRRLQLSIVQANSGSKIAQEGFKRLGIATKTASGQYKTAEQLLPELADSFAKLEDKTLKTALAQQLLGRSGTSLLPVFEQGSAAILARTKNSGCIDIGGIVGLSSVLWPITILILFGWGIIVIIEKVINRNRSIVLDKKPKEKSKVKI